MCLGLYLQFTNLIFILTTEWQKCLTNAAPENWESGQTTVCAVLVYPAVIMSKFNCPTKL